MPSLDDVLSNATSDDFEVDFSTALDFDPIDDGEYLAVLESVEPDVSASNNPIFIWKWKIREAGKYVGRPFITRTNRNGKGAGRTKQLLRALGVSVGDNERISFKGSQVRDQEAILRIGRQKDNPDFNEVKSYKASTDAAQSPIGL